MSKIFIITGDYSGDKHASGVAEELKKINPDIIIEGVGGLNLEKAGVKLLFNQDKMNTVGLTPKSVLNHLLMGRMIADYLKNEFKPDIVLLVDYGVFNLQMAKVLKREKIKVFYFIPPQIWASRKWRLHTIKKNVDRVFTIFPFEKEFYEKEGIKSTYVGHPLVSEIPARVNREEFFKNHGLDPNKKLVGVFPGSRIFEIHFLFKIFEKSVKIIEKAVKDVQFVFSLSENLKDDEYKTDYKVLKGENYALLSVSDALILASGTVALEAAMYETPMIIAYRGPFFFYLVYLLVRTIKKACLVNIITKKDVVPEFLMYNARPRPIAREIIKLLTDKAHAQEQIQGLKETKVLLGTGNTAQTTAKNIIEELKNG